MLTLGVLLVGLSTARSPAAESYALIVAGDPGRPVTAAANTLGDWSANFSRWSAAWETLLIGTYQFPEAHVTCLSSPDPSSPGSISPETSRADRGTVLAQIASVARRATSQDQVVLILIGHGYHSGVSGHFCLAGVDLTDSDLSQALSTVHCRELVILLLAPDLRDMVHALSGAGRVIILGNVRSSAPYFSEFLLRALAPGAVTLLQAFNQASLDTIHWYQNQQWLKDKHAWLVHGVVNQEVWRLVYPRGVMFAGDDQPHVAVTSNDPRQVAGILGRRMIAEVAGIDDNGDGEVSTVYDGGPVPAALTGADGADGAVAATLTLGKP